MILFFFFFKLPKQPSCVLRLRSTVILAAAAPPSCGSYMPTMSDSQPVVFGATPSSPDGVSDFLKTTVSTLKANGIHIIII